MPATTYKITHRDARSLMDAARDAAAKHDVPGAIAIVDAGGHPIALEALDNTMYGASTIALGKAATVVAFKRPTDDIEQVILKGRTPMLVLEGTLPQPYVPLKGGQPLWYKDQLIGAIAVAGTMDAQMDDVIALEAVINKGW